MIPKTLKHLSFQRTSKPNPSLFILLIILIKIPANFFSAIHLPKLFLRGFKQLFLVKCHFFECLTVEFLFKRFGTAGMGSYSPLRFLQLLHAANT